MPAAGKHLLFLVTEDWYFVSHRLALARAAKEAGFEVTVITRCNTKCAAIKAAGLRVVPFGMARRGLNPLGLLREVIGVARLYRNLRPDIVHHVALRPVVVGGLAARLAGVRNVVSAVAGMGYAFALTPSPSPRGRGEDALTPGPSPRGRGEDTLTPGPSPKGRGGPILSPSPASGRGVRGEGGGSSALQPTSHPYARRGSLLTRRLLGFALEKLLSLALTRGTVIVQNPDDAALVRQLGVADGRIALIPGAGVDTERFVPRPEPAGVPVVMLASRLLWDKGVGEFIEAARSLRGRARFVLVGAPDPGNPASVAEADLEAWVREGVVEWWGRRDDMAATLNAAHIVCLPSYREGMPKVLLEAMACGRACVTTDAPGCRDCVRDGDNGLIVPVKDAAALAAAIGRLLDDPRLRRQMGERGRQRAVTEFSQEVVIGATLALYRGALS